MNFESFMANAPKVLFNLGWALAIFTFVASVVPALGFGSGQMFFPAVLVGLAGAAGAVLVPWIAAAVIWRIDQYLERLK